MRRGAFLGQYPDRQIDISDVSDQIRKLCIVNSQYEVDIAGPDPGLDWLNITAVTYQILQLDPAIDHSLSTSISMRPSRGLSQRSDGLMRLPSATVLMTLRPNLQSEPATVSKSSFSADLKPE